MKYAGKKAGLMPTGKDVENAKDAKKPGDKKEDAANTNTQMPVGKGKGLAAFINAKMFKKSGK